MLPHSPTIVRRLTGAGFTAAVSVALLTFLSAVTDFEMSRIAVPIALFGAIVGFLLGANFGMSWERPHVGTRGMQRTYMALLGVALGGGLLAGLMFSLVT